MTYEQEFITCPRHNIWYVRTNNCYLCEKEKYENVSIKKDVKSFKTNEEKYKQALIDIIGSCNDCDTKVGLCVRCKIASDALE